MSLGPFSEGHTSQQSSAEIYSRQWGQRGQELVRQVNQRGYGRIDEIPGTDPKRERMIDAPLPSDWKSLRVTPILVENAYDLWVYDPTRIEVRTQRWSQIPHGMTPKQVEDQIANEGFEIIDGNIARSLYFRKKPQGNQA